MRIFISILAIYTILLFCLSFFSLFRLAGSPIVMSQSTVWLNLILVLPIILLAILVLTGANKK